MATRFIQNYINQLLNEAEEKPEKKPMDTVAYREGNVRDTVRRPDTNRGIDPGLYREPNVRNTVRDAPSRPPAQPARFDKSTKVQDAVDTSSAQPENRDKYDKILYGQGENPSDERRKMVDKMREQDKNRQNRYDHAPPAVKGALDSLRGGNLDGAIDRIENAGLQSKVGDIKSGVDSGRVRPRAETQVNTPGGHRLKGMERYIKDNPEYNQTTPIRSAVTGTRLRGLEKWRDNPRNPNQGQRVISPEGQAKVDSLEQGKQRDLDRYAEYGKYSKQLTDIAQNAYKRTRADYDRHYGSNNK